MSARRSGWACSMPTSLSVARWRAVKKYRTHDTIRNSIPDEFKKEADEAIAETNKGNYQAAIHIYRKIIPDNPDSEIVRNNVGCCLAELEKCDDAETEFIEALRITKSKRDKGIYVPRSFPKVPLRNLIKLYKYIHKHCPHARRLPKNDQNTRRPGPWENTVQRLGKIMERDGIVGVMKKIPLYLYPKSAFSRWQDKVIALRAEEFDRINTINTAGILYRSDLGMINKNQAYARYYLGSDSLFFHNAFSSLKINFNEYTFIDFGSGKGKALFLASAYPFKKIIGIEFSEVLHAIAQENIRQFKKDNIEAYRMDAADYTIPKEPLVCYFYDPFDDYIMAQVISAIRRGYKVYGKNVIIVYNTPRFYGLFDAEKWLERLNSIGPIMIWSSNIAVPVYL